VNTSWLTARLTTPYAPTSHQSRRATLMRPRRSTKATAIRTTALMIVRAWTTFTADRSVESNAFNAGAPLPLANAAPRASETPSTRRALGLADTPMSCGTTTFVMVLDASRERDHCD
jgi:hypothetical protein